MYLPLIFSFVYKAGGVSRHETWFCKALNSICIGTSECWSKLRLILLSAPTSPCLHWVVCHIVEVLRTPVRHYYVLGFYAQCSLNRSFEAVIRLNSKFIDSSITPILHLVQSFLWGPFKGLTSKSQNLQHKFLDWKWPPPPSALFHKFIQFGCGILPLGCCCYR